MVTGILTPLQAGFGAAGIVYGLLSVLLPVLAFYFIWSIRNNVRRIADDVEQIKEATENQQPNKRQ